MCIRDRSYTERTTDYYEITQNLRSSWKSYGSKIPLLEKKYSTRKFYITDTFDDYIRGSVTLPYGAGKQEVILNFKTGEIETNYPLNFKILCKPLNYSSSKSSGTLSKTFSYWWVVFILIALGGFIYTQLKPGKTKNLKIPKFKIPNQKNTIFTFIPILWRGDFPLAISFWVCLIIPSIFFTLLIRMPVTGTAEIILGLFALFFLIYSFIALGSSALFDQ